MEHPPVRIEGDMVAVLMSFVKPQVSAWLTIGSDAGKITVAPGQLVDHAEVESARM